MTLVYLYANQAWCFLFGDAPTRVGDGPLFYRTRAEAVRDALSCGLIVTRAGRVL